MKRKMYKAVALLMALAMLMGLALADETLDAADVDRDLESQDIAAGLEIDDEAMFSTDPAEEMPAELDGELTLADDDTMSDVTYHFVVDDGEYAFQIARAGDEIFRPGDPEAPRGKVFAGWTLADGTPLFVDADEDGEIDPVIVRDYELGTEVYIWAEFTDREEVEQPAGEEPAGEEPAGEEPAGEEPTGEEPTGEEPAGEEPAEGPVANELTYTGEAQALVNGEGAWLYSLDGEVYSEEIPTAVNAGEYTVYFKAAEADEPQAITVTVAKADAEFTPPVAATE